jgi:para-nitrobenzyl esterase
MGCVNGYPTPDGSAVQYLGLRFAEVPTGVNRWKAPVALPTTPSTSTSTTFEATQRFLCLQRSTHGGSGFDGSEAGCLTVDIWTPPGTPATAQLPVMAWIHGGSFMDFNPDPNSTDPTRMVAASVAMGRPVIVVSINYRLGGLGFMGSAALAAEPGANGSSGNYGILDQILALQWVQDHIAGFGGNRDEVTIFGESAGAYSICVLLASPLVKGRGLFARAAMDSAYCALTYQYQSLAQAVGSACEALHSCTGRGTLGCMRALNATEAYQCGPGYLVGAGRLPSYVDTETIPNIDGFVLTGPPLTAIASPTDGATVPVIVGSNRNEMMLFAISNPAFPAPWNLTSAERPALVSEQVFLQLSETWKRSTSVPSMVGSSADHEDALALYPASEYAAFAANAAPFFGLLCQSPENRATGAPCAFTAEAASIVAMATDLAFTLTAQHIADAVAQSGQPAYRYLFGENATGATMTGLPPNDMLARVGSFHSLDVAFLFGNFESYFDPFRSSWPAAADATTTATTLSATMMAYYINFAAGGDPNGAFVGAAAGAPRWPRWAGTVGSQYMELGGPDGTVAGSGFRSEQLAFWSRTAQQLGLGSGPAEVASSPTTTAPTTTAPTSAPTTTYPPGAISTVSKNKLSVGDDVGIGIAVFVVILLAAIGGAYFMDARAAKDVGDWDTYGDGDGAVLIG